VGVNYFSVKYFSKGIFMIVLQKLKGEEFVLNADLIESVEATPDTQIKLYTGKLCIVKNSVAEVLEKAIEYRKLCGGTLRVVNKKSEEDEL
jgi:flagellar protein FlbD